MVDSVSVLSVASEPPSTEALYEAHFNFVWANLRRLGVPEAQVEDAVHDVFGVVHRRRDTFDGSSRVRTWLYGILRRVASHYRRREQRHHRRLAAVRREPTVHDAAEDAVARREELRLVETFLRELDPPKREVFVLAHLEQMRGREIAELLAINPNTASARLRAARGALAEFAREHEIRPDEVEAVARQEAAPPETKRRVLAGLLPVFAVPVDAGGSPGVSARWTRIALAGSGVAALVLGAAATFAQPRADAPSPDASAVAAPAAEHARPNALPVTAATPPAGAAAETGRAAAPASLPRSAPADPKIDPNAALHGAPAGPAPRQRPRRAPPPVSEPPAPQADARSASTLAEQTRLARQIAASDDPQTILARVRAYERRFPGGFFAERLGFEAVSALCRLGRVAAARGRVATLRARHPDSSLLPRGGEPCGGEPPDGDTKIAGAGDTKPRDDDPPTLP